VFQRARHSLRTVWAQIVIKHAALPTFWLGLVLAAAPFAAMPMGATGPTWEHWKTVPGIFDVAGPRTDGILVVAGNAQLFLVDAAGDVSPFARGPQGYADDAGAEAYLTVSPGHAVSGAGCSFAQDDVFVLRLHAPLGITRIDSAGHASPFATVTGVDALNGIAFDTTGSFGYRLLVSGPSKGKTAIAAIDCMGTVAFITHTAPVLEGGLAVAPPDFAPYGGDLMAPDELSGKIYAIAPDGAVTEAAVAGLPSGQDIGVESVAFVPQGFTRGGATYYSDRGTPGNPHAGTDSLLRLRSPYLAGAGVHDGDLVGATEGGATMVDVRCNVTCQTFMVVQTTSTSHGEGHIAFTVDKVSAPASSHSAPRPQPASPNREPLVVIAVLLSIAAAAIASTLAGRSRLGDRSKGL
jgi:hypothetical protein